MCSSDLVPVLPVPLVAAALVDGPVPRAVLAARIDGMIGRLVAGGAALELPEGGAGAAMAEGLRVLIARDIVEETAGALRPAPAKAVLLAYYAASVQQELERISPPV